MLKNELLQKALSSVESGVQNKELYSRFVSAGSKLIYDQGTFAKLSESIVQASDPVEEVAKGMTAIFGLMRQKARGTIPEDAVPAMLQAGMALLLDALDFMEQSGLVTVDAKVLEQATTTFIETLLPSLGIPAQKLGGLLSMVQQQAGDPQKLAAFKQSMGG